MKKLLRKHFSHGCFVSWVHFSRSALQLPCVPTLNKITSSCIRKVSQEFRYYHWRCWNALFPLPGYQYQFHYPAPGWAGGWYFNHAEIPLTLRKQNCLVSWTALAAARRIRSALYKVMIIMRGARPIISALTIHRVIIFIFLPFAPDTMAACGFLINSGL